MSVREGCAQYPPRVVSEHRAARVWVVVERDPMWAPLGVTSAATFECEDLPTARAWCEEASRRMPWLARHVEVRAPDGAHLPSDARHPPLRAALDPRRSAWALSDSRNLGVSSSAQIIVSSISLDVLDDVVVLRGEHVKGGHPASERVPIDRLLRSDAPLAPFPGAIARAVRDAIAAHRLPGRALDPSHAALHGDAPRLEALLAGGTALDHTDALERSPLAAALEGRHEDIAMRLLDRGASWDLALRYLVGDGDAPSLDRALVVALRLQMFRLAQRVSELGASPNASAEVRRGAPAIGVRAWELGLLGGAPVALLTTMLRAATGIVSSAAWTTSAFVARARRDPALAALSPVPLPPLPVMAAPSATEVEAAAQRAAHQRERRLQDRAQRALSAAVLQGAIATIRSHASVVNVRGSDGQVALHHASLAPLEHQAEVVATLRSLGAAVDEPDRSGATPLSKAVRRGALEAVRALLRGGASVAVRDEGSTLLAHAVIADAPDVVGALLAASPPPSEEDRRGAIELSRARGRAACLAKLEGR